MAENIWADYGMTWNEEVVSRQTGPNKTDRVAFNTKAQIPAIADFDKFCDHFGKATVLAFINASNSIRVRAQAINREKLDAGEKSVDALRTAVYNGMKGIRATATPVTIVKNVYTLPDGTTYDGTDLVEYQQSYALALVTAGVDASVATMIAQQQKFA